MQEDRPRKARPKRRVPAPETPTPLKRFDYVITEGPLKGQECRWISPSIVRESQVLVEHMDGRIRYIRIDHIEKKHDPHRQSN